MEDGMLRGLARARARARARNNSNSPDRQDRLLDRAGEGRRRRREG